MINKSVVAKSNEDLYPESREAMTNKFVSPWAVVKSLLRSGRLLSVANRPHCRTLLNLTYARESYVTPLKVFFLLHGIMCDNTTPRGAAASNPTNGLAY